MIRIVLTPSDWTDIALPELNIASNSAAVLISYDLLVQTSSNSDCNVYSRLVVDDVEVGYQKIAVLTHNSTESVSNEHVITGLGQRSAYGFRRTVSGLRRRADRG